MRGASTNVSHRRERSSNSSHALLLVLGIVIFGALYVSWRIPHNAETPSRLSDGFLMLVALIAGAAALSIARADGPDRRNWLLIAIGALLWSIAQTLRYATSDTAMLVYTAAFLVSAAALVVGSGRLAGFGKGPGGFRSLGFDIGPPFIALVIIMWLIDLGPILQNYDVPPLIAVAAILHAASSVGLIVVGLMGILAARTLHLTPGVQSLMAGMALLAVADAFWMQRWIERDITYGIAADIAFSIGFITIAIGALQTRWLHNQTMRRPSVPIVAKRLSPYGAPIALLVLLASIPAQEWIGISTNHGVIICAIGAMVIVALTLMADMLITDREQALSGEIDLLSERIDGLVSQVGRDPLTGLLNRRAFEERLDHELILGRTHHQSVGLALIDVDNFKQVNDNLGHAVGDQVLQAVASILTGLARSSDVAARYAGDEFVMIFPGITEETAATISHRMVTHVRALNEQLGALSGVRTSLSVGVAISQTCKRNAAQMTAIADAAMYDAKEGGKDRVVVADADTLTAVSYWGADPAMTQRGANPANRERRSTRSKLRQAS